MILVIKQVQKLTGLMLLWVSLPTFLLLTNPEELPLLLLLVPFALLLTVLFVTARVGFSVLFTNLSPKRLRLLSVLSAVFPTLLLVLASINQLTIRDTAIIMGLLLALIFYLQRIDFLKT